MRSSSRGLFLNIVISSAKFSWQLYIKPMAMPWFAVIWAWLFYWHAPQSPHCVALLVETWPWYLEYYYLSQLQYSIVQIFNVNMYGCWYLHVLCKSDKFCVWSWYCSVLQWYCIHWNAMMQQWMWSTGAGPLWWGHCPARNVDIGWEWLVTSVYSFDIDVKIYCTMFGEGLRRAPTTAITLKLKHLLRRHFGIW